MIDRLADTIATQHGQAEPVYEAEAALSVPATIVETASRLDDLTETNGLHAGLTLWRGEVTVLAHRLAGRMEERRRSGKVRHGHGALHLGHIGMVDGVPVPFDALDTEDRAATGDVLYDLAFLLMDLVAQDRKDLANRLLNRYLVTTEDYDGLDLMALFMSLRAATRAADCLRADGPTCRAGANYLTLAVDLLNAGRPPVLVAIGGASDGARSALSAALATAIPGPFGAVTLTGADDRTHTLRLAGLTLDAGQSAILDPCPCDPATCGAVRVLAETRGVTFRGLWLDTGRRAPACPADWKRMDAGEPLRAMTARCLRALTTSTAARWPSPSGT